MERYILEQIKANKIKNNVHCPIVMFEKDIFTYEGKEYINIYVYSKNNFVTMDVNNKKPISSNFANLISLDFNDKFHVVCFLHDDVKDNMVITKYHDGSGVHDVKEIDLIDYDDIDFNSNNLAILEKLNLKGFKELTVLPKIKDNYWICSCGEFNTEKECKNCSTKKGFIEYYATEKSIQQKYAEKKFNKQKFSSENMEEEIENFKNNLLNDYKYVIKKQYLDKEFFENLLNDSKNKVVEFRNRDNRNKYIKKNFKLILIIAVIVFVVALILSYVKNSNNTKEIINKYCDNSNYKNVSSIEKAIKSNDCGTMVHYISTNRLSYDDKEKLIKSDNKTYYSVYYELKKENIHESMGGNELTLSYTYMQYLGENNYEIPEDSINDALNKLVVANDKENFAKIASLLKGRDISWAQDSTYLNYGYQEYIKKDEKYNLDYQSAKENTKKYTELSKIYHEQSGNNECFVADLHSVENMKYLIEQKDNKVCEYTFSNALSEYDISYMKMYHEAGGSFSYSSYLGGFFHHLASDAKYDKPSASDFEEKVKLLKTYKADINLKMEKDDADPGFTPLDTFFENFASTCRDAAGNYPTAYEVKNCNTYKSYYKVLKKYGAVCNKNCDDEKYFK